MSCRLGQTLAGLLNASFGNAVEIIVGVAALLRGAFYARCSFTAIIHMVSDELRIVQNSVSAQLYYTPKTANSECLRRCLVLFCPIFCLYLAALSLLVGIFFFFSKIHIFLNIL